MLLLPIVLVTTFRVKCVELGTLFLHSYGVWLRNIWASNLRSLIFLVSNKSGIPPGIPCLVAIKIAYPSLLFILVVLFH